MIYTFRVYLTGFVHIFWQAERKQMTVHAYLLRQRAVGQAKQATALCLTECKSNFTPKK